MMAERYARELPPSVGFQVATTRNTKELCFGGVPLFLSRFKGADSSFRKTYKRVYGVSTMFSERCFLAEYYSAVSLHHSIPELSVFPDPCDSSFS